MSQYYPPYRRSSNNIKVELDLANYATKTDLNNITHVDVSSFASKTNLAALKTEVDKIDADKLKTAPTDLAKLTNAIENDVVKKTDYNSKVTSIEAQIAGLTKNTVDNLADITKLKAIDANSFVTRIKFSADTNASDDKIDGVEKKPPDISGLATKTSLNDYLQTSTFNSKVTEVENKIKNAEIMATATKADLANDITTIKNDYVANASLTSRLYDLKAQHIATEVKTIDDKTKKNASDILGFENRLKQKEDIVDENQRELSFNRGFFYYLQQRYLVYECKVNSFAFNGKKIANWRSTGIFNYSDYYVMNGIEDTKTNRPLLKNKETYVLLQGNYFQENNKIIIPNNNKNVINIYVAYKLDPISSTRNTDYTI